MSDLFDKLNVLIRSKLAPGGGSGTPAGGKITLGKDADREIATMRKQIDAAITKQDKMKADLEALQGQVAALDTQADKALERSDEAGARQLIQQMQQKRARARQLEQELERHRASTSELIEHVNMLEAVVSEARLEKSQTAHLAEPDAEPQTTEAAGQDLLRSLSDAFNVVRKTVEDMITPPARETTSIPVGKSESSTDAPSAPQATIPVTKSESRAEAKPEAGPGNKTAPDAPKPAKPAVDPAVEEDLARRRSRLSSPE